jgi:hypothetical protein
MIHRSFWLGQIEAAWRRRSVIWLSGVRRVGKTMLTQSLADAEYFDCELPRLRATMSDPEAFLKSLKGKRVVLDEIHRLPEPAELLKIAADHFPQVKVVATGSSTLSAAAKFKDTLTGRKVEIHLLPMMSVDVAEFGGGDLGHRLGRGGLPPFYQADLLPERDFQEWMDAYWAKDIQEMFRLERRASFLRFVELVLVSSGGIFEATSFAGPCEVSRTTIGNYLAVLEATRVAHVVRPFSSRRRTEIVAAPKVYGFDTGFVAYYRGWQQLRTDDLGKLWEHFVLNELQSHFPGQSVGYWRDLRGHEVDFVISRRGQAPIAIECKWSATRAGDTTGLAAFRRAYPQGDNYLVGADVEKPSERRVGELRVQVVGLADLVRRFAPKTR